MRASGRRGGGRGAGEPHHGGGVRGEPTVQRDVAGGGAARARVAAEPAFHRLGLRVGRRRGPGRGPGRGPRRAACVAQRRVAR